MIRVSIFIIVESDLFENLFTTDSINAKLIRIVLIFFGVISYLGLLK